MRGQALIASLILTIAMATTSAGAATDTPENRQTSAEAYLEAVPPHTLFDNLKDHMNSSGALKPADQKVFEEAVAQVDLTALRTAMLASLVRTFTTDELEAMTNFYGSPEGRSIAKKLPAYMSDIAPVLQGEMMRIMQQVMGSKSKSN